MDNLNQLKVADLKQALKTRGLSIVGNKSDLIQRLETALLKESTVNAQTKNIEKEIDEDAILGGDDDEDVDVNVTIGKDDAIIPNEDLLLSETALDLKSPTVPTLKSTNVSETKNTSSNVVEKKSPVKNVPSNQTEATNLAKDQTTVVPSLKQLVKDKDKLTPEERKQLRALKFADPKVLKRAERFGVQTPTSDSAPENKLLKRAQRFGEVVSTKAKELDEKQRMLKRAERFGNLAISSSTTQPKVQTNVDEKIMKRQERFGKVEKTATTITTNNGKRRRFAV